MAIAILFLDKRSLFCGSGRSLIVSETGFLFLNLGIVAKATENPVSWFVGKKAIAPWLNSLCPSCLCGSIVKKLSWRSLFYFWISDRFFIGQFAIACGSETGFLVGILDVVAKIGGRNPVSWFVGKEAIAFLVGR